MVKKSKALQSFCKSNVNFQLSKKSWQLVIESVIFDSLRKTRSAMEHSRLKFNVSSMKDQCWIWQILVILSKGIGIFQEVVLYLSDFKIPISSRFLCRTTEPILPTFALDPLLNGTEEIMFQKFPFMLSRYRASKSQEKIKAKSRFNNLIWHNSLSSVPALATWMAARRWAASLVTSWCVSRSEPTSLAVHRPLAAKTAQW